ncbi:hypothetical protein MAR621_01819 [Maribacter dokdonensis]|uniref:hypothetical protein n=1 Tax=Maribacter dokdonensis TaxID=320912 RepID=UPI001B243BF7|nr:hypothetical protein [Maribacter dokdonensis]CAG2531295.1 hypothetical protein MAR621_01819 [Maribacter dokdonensis]
MNQSKKYEAPFTEDDLKIIQSKSKKSNVAWFIVNIVLGVIAIGLLKQPGFGFIEFLACLFFVISFIPYFRFFYKSPTEKDLEAKIKVSTELKVKYKRRNMDNFHHYEIEFEQNPDFDKYSLLKKDFKRVNVGDVIYIEFSKYGRWILKMECNDEDIENPFYVK